MTLKQALMGYSMASVVIVAMGIWLPHLGIQIARAMGCSSSFVGTLFVAMATSLPELATTWGAIRIGAVDLAFGNLLGSNLFDVLILVLDDVAYTSGPIWSACSGKPSIKELVDYEEFCGLKARAEPTPEIEEITATELNNWFQGQVDFQLIDVREPHEFEIARIPTAQRIPLGEVVNRICEIPKDKVTVVRCKGGVRSARAIGYLKDAGFEGRLINLEGGIRAWSDQVDSSVPKY